MSSKQVDAYIEDAPEFAKPFLIKVRKLVHEACPGAEETIKWSVPHFEHKGVLVGVSAHKKHINLIFWKSNLMQDTEGLFEAAGSMKPIRIEEGEAPPSDRVLRSYIRQAVALNEAGAKPEPRKSKPKPDIETPKDLVAALAKNKAAKAVYEGFAPSHRREYVEWIEEAKRPETRERRIAQAVEQIAEGKGRNWKYQRKKTSKGSQES
ncbi:MAG: YdeI/OmpD-associated family protein [Bryobacterales bacterium]|nr:YdeI/OmpD-associated family protein [Bryobacterales bacterium]